MKDTLLLQAKFSRFALHRNLEGLTHEQSLMTPERGGNCANWVLGHLVTTYDNVLKAIGGEPIRDAPDMDPYRRGAEPLDPAKARPLDELLADFDRSHERFIARLAELTAEDVARPSPVSPRNDPDETIGSLLALIAFHQAYHVGQLGLLRRAAGRKGAIA